MSKKLDSYNDGESGESGSGKNILRVIIAGLLINVLGNFVSGDALAGDHHHRHHHHHHHNSGAFSLVIVPAPLPPPRVYYYEPSPVVVYSQRRSIQLELNDINNRLWSIDDEINYYNGLPISTRSQEQNINRNIVRLESEKERLLRRRDYLESR